MNERGDLLAFAMAFSPRNEDRTGWYRTPEGGKAASVLVAILSLCLLSGLLTHKCLKVTDWKTLPWIMWLVILTYGFSFIFVVSSSFLQMAFGTDKNFDACSAATIICLGLYVVTKVFIYLFLVDRVHIIRDTSKSRLRSKLYIFNSFGMIGVYVIIIIMDFIFRITNFDKGYCVIGMQQPVMVPLIGFDAFVNVYLTTMFLIPLTRLHSLRFGFWETWTVNWDGRNVPRAPPNVRLQRLALKTFIGSCCALTSSIANLTVLMALKGEVAWLCLMLCNSDIVFSAIVIQWVTSNDTAANSRRNNKPSIRAVATTTTAVQAPIMSQGPYFLCDGCLASTVTTVTSLTTACRHCQFQSVVFPPGQSGAV